MWTLNTEAAGQDIPGTKAFPDPKRFLGKLHDRGMHTTLNVHPADGVQGCEEMYVDMAKEMGVDYENEDPVVCDPASPKFMDAYFKYLHHPREAEGVDFWWIDWQQGSNCKVEGLDPLWIFNHFHYLDNKRDGRRPMTFSRYAGPGSHRYPIGFREIHILHGSRSIFNRILQRQRQTSDMDGGAMILADICLATRMMS